MSTLHRIALTLLLCMSAATAAHAQQPSPPMHAHGVHGMALFGGDNGLFAAHLPMFRHPHDRQALIALRIVDATLDAHMRRTLGAAPALWTLVPERFDLWRLQAVRDGEPLRLRADLVRGHFERGGETVHRDVAIEVHRVLRFEPLDPTPRAAPRMQYGVYGHGRTWFAIKHLDVRPDIDHIVMLRCARAPCVRNARMVDIATDFSAEGPSLDEALQRSGFPRLRVRGTVYRDAADLQ